MQSWDLKTVEAEPHQPQILASADDARTIVLHLPAGEELQEHEVHERARLEFDPGERHTISARSDTRLLLILTPWPGDGHPGAMTLEQKAEARQRAAEHPSRS